MGVSGWATTQRVVGATWQPANDQCHRTSPESTQSRGRPLSSRSCQRLDMGRPARSLQQGDRDQV